MTTRSFDSAQDVPLLQTKLYVPPPRPDLVPRSHLIERLNAGLHRKLTLVSAPAGFGKTTLVAEWASAIGRPVGWLSLDKGDNDPARFWRYVVAALQTMEPAIGSVVMAALQSQSSLRFEQLVTSLINDVAERSVPLVLVLDDYHVIEDDTIHRSLGFLLDHLPPRLHVVAVTRADPPLSLPRRRGRAEVSEVRAADLCFTRDEAAAFLNTCMSLALSPDDVAALEERTEGWIVGLQMAALSLQGRSDKRDFVEAFAGDDRHVGDYLVEEVLHRQPEHIQDFLLRTAILGRLCGSLCDAVLCRGAEERGRGRELSPASPHLSSSVSGQEILEYLDRARLFLVPLDDRREWYRYHHLFADLLRSRLQRSERASEVATLHLRASAWYEREGSVSEAVSHALASGDEQYTAGLIARHWEDMFHYGNQIPLCEWIEALPERVVRANPALGIAYALASRCTPTPAAPPDGVGAWKRWTRSIEKALADQQASVEDADSVTNNDVLAGYLAMLRAWDFGRDPADDLERALRRLPEADPRLRSFLSLELGFACRVRRDEEGAARAFAQAGRLAEACGVIRTVATVACIQAGVARRQGRLHEAAAILAKALRTASGPGEKGQVASGIGALEIDLAVISLEWNDLADAERRLARGVPLVGLTGNGDWEGRGYITLARLRQAQGDAAGAFEAVERVERTVPSAARYVAAQRACLWLALAEGEPRFLTQASQWARTIGLDEREGEKDAWPYDDWHDMEQFALARVLIAQRRARRSEPDLQPVLEFLQRKLDATEASNWIERGIEVWMLRALALQAQGDADRASASLEQALALAEPGGYVRAFVEEGMPMARMLYTAAERDVAPEYVGRLLAAFPDAVLAPAEHARAARLEAEMVEPLSEREIEVLSLIAEGLPNRQVAQRLVISPNTVRVHTSNIYGKLSVSNRTQAVAKARGLGILPSR
ncbi:MAG: LuxR C-terminal-related transcriptional regulator [Chloroflexota bacterium]|nr:LuxR C-terminal-related transcriptional regulator [Chloroflexota bacterium]